MAGPDAGSKSGRAPPGSPKCRAEIPHIQSGKQVRECVRAERAQFRGAGPGVGPRDDGCDRSVDGAVGIGEAGGPDAESVLELIGALDHFTIDVGRPEGRQPGVGSSMAAEGHAGVTKPGEVVPTEQRQGRNAGRRPATPAIVAAGLPGHDEAGRRKAMGTKDRDNLTQHAAESIVERERGRVDPVVQPEQLIDTHDLDVTREEPRDLAVELVRGDGDRRPRSVERVPGQDGAHSQSLPAGGGRPRSPGQP